MRSSSAKRNKKAAAEFLRRRLRMKPTIVKEGTWLARISMNGAFRPPETRSQKPEVRRHLRLAPRGTSFWFLVSGFYFLATH
jgi:hypothetical protein